MPRDQTRDLAKEWNAFTITLDDRLCWYRFGIIIVSFLNGYPKGSPKLDIPLNLRGAPFSPSCIGFVIWPLLEYDVYMYHSTVGSAWVLSHGCLPFSNTNYVLELFSESC